MAQGRKTSVADAFTVWERRNYKWRNWRHAQGGALFFPGCALPSFFPETELACERLLSEHGVGCALDCCGAALDAPLGAAEARRQAGRVEERARRAGVDSLVAACPNCARALAARTGLPVESVYARLAVLGLQAPEAAPGAVFVPCPDRAERAWLAQVQELLGGGAFALDAGCCCGAAFVNERPDDAARAARRVLDAACEACAAAGAEPLLYVYCASCAGQLERARLAAAKEGDADLGRLRIVHALSALLGVEEAPAVSSSLANRVKASRR